MNLITQQIRNHHHPVVFELLLQLDTPLHLPLRPIATFSHHVKFGYLMASMRLVRGLTPRSEKRTRLDFSIDSRMFRLHHDTASTTITTQIITS